VKPHTFRHSFTSAVLDAADGNLLIARDAGGWASTATVDEVYGHADIHDPAFDAGEGVRLFWSAGSALGSRSVSAGVVLRRPVLLCVGLFAGHAA
jgi:hypothetical protein